MHRHDRLRRLWSPAALLAAALVATVLPLAGPASAAPPAPTGLVLSVESGVNTPTLAWDRVDGAARYEVWVDDDPAFASATKTTTVNSRWVPATPLPAVRHYWQVRSVGTDSTQSGWSSADFDVAALGGPSLAFPPHDPDGDPALELGQPDEPPLLMWQPVAGAVQYTVEVDDDELFLEGKRAYLTKSTSIVVPDQKANGRYFWRVTADLGGGVKTLPSDTWAYHISPLPEVENAVEIGTEEDVVLDWDPVDGAKSYNVWVSTDPDFNDTSETVLAPSTEVYGTRFSPTVTFLNNDTYYWKVRAVNADGEAKNWPSVTRHEFARRWPDKPALVWPPNQISPAVSDPLYYQWTPVDHASHYEVQVGTDPNFTTGSFERCYTASTTYTPGDLAPDDRCIPGGQGGTYYWRVRALDEPADVLGIYSEVGRFIYDPGRTQLTAPANGAAVTVPTLSWEPARDAERYRVTIRKDGGIVDQAVTYALSYTPAELLVPGTYSWGVVPLDANGAIPVGYGTWRTFTVTGPPEDTALPHLTPITGTLADGASVRFPSLSWEIHPDAHHYRINIGDHGSGYWHATSDSIATTDFQNPAATSLDSTYLDPGRYDWQVSAYTEAGAFLGRGPVGTFEIATLGPVQARRLALSGAELNPTGGGTPCQVAPPAMCDDVPATPVLAWDPVPGAALYKVFVSRDPDITNYVFGTTPANVPRTVNTMWTPRLSENPDQLPDSTAGVPYYWYVLPCKTVAHCDPDPSSQTDQEAFPKRLFEKVSPAPVLVSPADGATLANDITFTWTDYLATNQATAWEPTGERSHQSGTRYRLQVATQEADFEDNIVDDVLVDQVTYTPADRTYPEGNLYWRVQATDVAGNALAWSPIRHVFKQSPTPVLTSPVDLEQVGGSEPFRWAATAFAGSYHLEVYKNDDATYSTANRVINVTTKQTAYAHNEPLPVAAQPYRWRVQRLDAQGKPGSYGASGRFLVVGEAPDHLAPADGSTSVANDLSFAWSSVANASRYRLEYRRTGTTSGTTITTAALGHAPTTALAAGSWEWRITSLDTDSGVLGVSTWQPFTVIAAGGNLTVVAPPTIEGNPWTGQTLTATRATFAPVPDSTTLQWFRDGSPIAGATGTMLELGVGDLGGRITVAETAVKSGLAPTTATSAATAPVEPAPGSPIYVRSAPAVAGQARVGQTLTVTSGSYAPTPTGTSVQWLRDGLAVEGATGTSYLLTAADLGLPISVAQTATRSGYGAVTSTSAPTVPVAEGPAPQVVTLPRVTGTARVGATLTAVAGTYSPAASATSLQWMVGNLPVDAATQQTYLVRPGDVGKTIHVVETATVAGYAPRTAASASTAAVVLGAAPTVTVAPSIDGVAKVGETLTAVSGTYTPAPDSARLEWLRNGTPVAEGRTYVVLPSDAGQAIRVRETVTKEGHAPAVGTSAVATVSAGDAPAVVTNPVITGTAQVGQPLTLVPGGYSPRPVGVTRQWFRDNVPIGGAVGSTYVLTAADQGAVITATETTSLPGYAPRTASAAGVGPVAPAAGAGRGGTPPPPGAGGGVAAVTPVLSVKASDKARTVKLVVTVTAGGRSPAGPLKVYRGRKLVKTVTVPGTGRITVKLRSQPTGTQRYRVLFVGTPTLLATSTTVKVKV